MDRLVWAYLWCVPAHQPRAPSESTDKTVRRRGQPVTGPNKPFIEFWSRGLLSEGTVRL